MKKDKDTLNLVLTYKWFDEVLSGRKKEDYREPSPYNYRLMCILKDGLPIDFKPFKFVKFHKAYTKGFAVFEIKGMFLDQFINEIPEGFNKGDECITIEIGNLIDKNV